MKIKIGLLFLSMSLMYSCSTMSKQIDPEYIPMENESFVLGLMLSSGWDNMSIKIINVDTEEEFLLFLPYVKKKDIEALVEYNTNGGDWSFKFRDAMGRKYPEEYLFNIYSISPGNYYIKSIGTASLGPNSHNPMFRYEPNEESFLFSIKKSEIVNIGILIGANELTWNVMNININNPVNGIKTMKDNSGIVDEYFKRAYPNINFDNLSYY